MTSRGAASTDRSMTSEYRVPYRHITSMSYAIGRSSAEWLFGSSDVISLRPAQQRGEACTCPAAAPSCGRAERAGDPGGCQRRSACVSEPCEDPPSRWTARLNASDSEWSDRDHASTDAPSPPVYRNKHDVTTLRAQQNITVRSILFENPEFNEN